MKDDVKVLIKNICEESSIHGLPYVIEPKFHWFERIFWIFFISLATYFSFALCLNQWERFRDKPIIFTVEKNFEGVQFPYPGMTMCSNFYDQKKNQEIVEK